MVRALTGEWRNKDGREALQATGVGDHAEGKRLGNAVWDEGGGRDDARECRGSPVEAHCRPQGDYSREDQIPRISESRPGRGHT